MKKLGELKRIKHLTSIWPSEARDFTPWLAREENLELVGETLGFGSDWLELVEIEASVGRFRADIVCRDTGHDDQFVLIENQYGSTDHDHLGKLLTYAAGRKTKTVIWIAELIRDEHRAAIDLLNDATSDDYQFFALEIELWQIGDSRAAPRFNVVAKPNEWTRTISKTTRASSNTNLTTLQKTYIEYWDSFKNLLTEKSQLRCQKPSPQQWMYIPIGRSGFTLTASVNTQQSWVQAALDFHSANGKKFFHLMQAQKGQIDNETDTSLNWEELPNRKGSRIGIKTMNVDPTQRSSWNEQHSLLIEQLELLYILFHKRVKELGLEQYSAEETEGLQE